MALQAPEEPVPRWNRAFIYQSRGRFLGRFRGLLRVFGLRIGLRYGLDAAFVRVFYLRKVAFEGFHLRLNRKTRVDP